MDATPTVTFLIPAYNAAATLGASLTSALQQSRPADEILVINDGSTDATADILAAMHDPRLHVVTQTNQGLAATLNRGIELAKGTYIARLDSDDIALHERLGDQLAFMEANSSVALLGTWAQVYVRETPSDRFHRHPTESNTLKLELLFDNPFVHSSVMYRRDVVRQLGGYRVEQQMRIPEDYEFWSRIARTHEIRNLPVVHTIYREMPNSITRLNADDILNNVIAISTDNLQFVLPDLSRAACSDLARLYHGRPLISREAIAIRAIGLWRRAALATGGPSQRWTPQFRTRYRLAQRRLLVHAIRQALPRPVIKLLRQVRRFLRPKT